MDIVKHTYDKLVDDSAAFDVNDLWDHFIDIIYIKGASKYIAYLGGNVNYLTETKKSTPWMKAIWHMDKPMIELLLVEYDCDISIKSKGGDDFEYYASRKNLEEFVNHCLARRKLVVEVSDLKKQLEDKSCLMDRTVVVENADLKRQLENYDCVKRTNTELEETIQSMNKVFEKMNVDWVDYI